MINVVKKTFDEATEVIKQLSAQADRFEIGLKPSEVSR
jgi:hypothetical protein